MQFVNYNAAARAGPGGGRRGDILVCLTFSLCSFLACSRSLRAFRCASLFSWVDSIRRERRDSVLSLCDCTLSFRVDWTLASLVLLAARRCRSICSFACKHVEISWNTYVCTDMYVCIYINYSDKHWLDKNLHTYLTHICMYVHFILEIIINLPQSLQSFNI